MDDLKSKWMMIYSDGFLVSDVLMAPPYFLDDELQELIFQSKTPVIFCIQYISGGHKSGDFAGQHLQ